MRTYKTWDNLDRQAEKENIAIRKMLPIQDRRNDINLKVRPRKSKFRIIKDY